MTTTFTTIENLVRDRITYCAKQTDWTNHYWYMTLENGGGDFCDYGIMDDYEWIMERLVATITDIMSDYSQGVFTRFGSERDYTFESELMTASVALFEGSRASITICYDEQESESDLTELGLDNLDLEELGLAVLAATREDKLAELGLV
jgi:hypothetical protein